MEQGIHWMGKDVLDFVNKRSIARRVLLHEEKDHKEKSIFDKNKSTLAIYYDEEYKVFCDIADTDQLFVPTYERDFSIRFDARLAEENRLVDLLREAVEHDSQQQIYTKFLYDLDAILEAYKRLQSTKNHATCLVMNPIQFTTFNKKLSSYIEKNSLKDKILGGSFGKIQDAEIYLSQACSVREMFVVGERYSTGVVVTRGIETGMAIFDTQAAIRIESLKPSS